MTCGGQLLKPRNFATVALQCTLLQSHLQYQRLAGGAGMFEQLSVRIAWCEHRCRSQSTDVDISSATHESSPQEQRLLSSVSVSWARASRRRHQQRQGESTPNQAREDQSWNKAVGKTSWKSVWKWHAASHVENCSYALLSVSGSTQYE